MRSARVLFPYLGEQEAVFYLKGGRPRVGQDVSAEREKWRQARDRLVRGPARPPEDVGRRELPADLARRANEIAATAEFQMLMGDVQCGFGIVRLAAVLSFQSVIFVDVAEPDFSGVQEGELGSVFDVTLPAPKEVQIEIMQDIGTTSYTISSPNPNLRIGGMGQADVQIPVGQEGLQHRTRLFGYHLTYGSRWMQAVEFEGRWFLRDGYHRAYRLLQRGITDVPCVLVYARSLQEVYGGRAGFIAYDLIYGDRPPRLADFLTDLAIEVSIPTMRKVIRVRTDEFQVLD